jgi:anti-sigma factor RsiW
MNCSQIRRKLSAFIDSELDGATSRLIEQHLEGCPECRENLIDFREVNELVQGLEKIDPGPDFSSRVVTAAMRTSVAANRETVSFAARLKLALARLSEAVFRLFEPGAGPNTQTLDEFNDCPPLSMSFIYFRLLDQRGGGY